MARYCSDCTYLNTDKAKKKGNYMCEKTSKFVLTNTPSCPNFCNCYSRNSFEKESLYEEAKNIEEVSSPIPLLFILVISIIIKIIVG